MNTANAAWALIAAGCLVLIGSSAAALLTRSFYVRLHFLSPVTSLAAPLIGLGLAIDAGWSLTGGLDLVIAGLLAMTGPALTAATGRVAAQQDNLVPSQDPG